MEMTALLLAAFLTAPPPEITAEQFFSGEFDGQEIRAICTVKDVFRDEINPDYCYLIFWWNDEAVYAAVPVKGEDVDAVQNLVGARIAVNCTAIPKLYGQREKLGRNLQIRSLSAIQVLEPPSDDPFAVPELSGLEGSRPGDLWRGHRRKFEGTVLAVWGGSQFLVKGIDQHGMPEYVRVRLANSVLPSRGETVLVAGDPETDLYHYTLTRAVWRRRAGARADREEAVLALTAKEMMIDLEGQRLYRSDLHGRAVRLQGRVRRVLNESGFPQILVEDGGILVPVEMGIDASDNLPEPGCDVEVTGICIMDIEHWQANSVFPQIRGFFLVARESGDIRVLARPPWWTTGRLLVMVGVLALLVAAFFVWNMSLRVLAARRGRELFRAQIENAKTRLKSEERTRLAVELHDSLAQSLTGVSIQIEAGNNELAAKTLKSCRVELRNCLWDLRSAALDEPDLTRAVLRTLKQHLDENSLSVRLDVPRARLSDNAAHTLLCAVRELAVNAVRHGGATRIRIAGAADEGIVRVSVTDNGQGFDPVAAPGIQEGHFGLVGVRERIERFGGTFTITSSPGQGTRAVFTIHNESSHDVTS